MNQVIVIAVLFAALLILEFNEQKHIVFAAHTTKVKYLIALVISAVLLVLFWRSDIVYDAKIILIAVLLCSVAFLKQGLGPDKVITYGSVLMASDYKRYDLITFDKQEDQSRLMVTFRSKKSGGYSLFFTDNQDQVISFLRKLVGVHVMSEAEYERQQQDKQKKQEQFNHEAVEVIRNRKRKSVKEILHDSLKNRVRPAQK
ncbi:MULTISPECIES: hypothetical protein [unclassified Lacticaseibacillus]|uniref:hypothetical protein n=1 Tax=unclassified Lacticaseibacillus TaxID=2759744 RepID=UPI0019411AC0|nr:MULTISPECIES: hypothetical protein [unclassified Lacticaseibacillus]